LDPALQEVQLGRGKLLVAQGKFAEAKPWLDRFIASSPSHVDALATRARLEVKRERPLAAAEDYARILDLSRKAEPEYYLEYARALEAAGPEHIGRALAVLDGGIKALGPIPTLTLLAIDLEVARKDFDGALARVEQISAASKRKEPWLERRGDILQQAGRSAEARSAYVAALSEVRDLPARVRTRKATIDLENRLRAKIGPAAPAPRSLR
jgi:tetratricopeptide (TPR) repeat protein